MPHLTDQACGPQCERLTAKLLPVTPYQKVLRKFRRFFAKTGQSFMDFSAPSDEQTDETHWDFHNALKVRAMDFHIPTQLIWESTLTGSRSIQDPATVAWNFFTALYYKAGNMPWELDFTASDACFVGVSFYRESPDPASATRTSLAQVFSETGEGLVLKGEPVLWDAKRDRKPHLSESAATGLLDRAIRLYEEHRGHRPARVVVHKTSRFWPEELRGFRQALRDIKNYDFLALERRGIRFLRLGYEPPVRGTVVLLAKRNYLVYTRGYVPFLRCYPGMRIPNPLEVVEHHGDSSPDKVCSELLALTKLNWNNCSFASADPVTIAFSRQVGQILTEVRSSTKPESKYKFYM
jgi:hypothetical protein